MNIPRWYILNHISQGQSARVARETIDRFNATYGYSSVGTSDIDGQHGVPGDLSRLSSGMPDPECGIISGSVAPIDLFAPGYFEQSVRPDGRRTFRRVSLAYHYVFVRGTLQQVKALCAAPNGFSFVLNRASSARYAIASDAEMAAFRIIARGYQNTMPFFSIEDVDLEHGDLVEVVNGDFAGLRGTYIPRQGSSSGKIVLAIAMGRGTCAYDISVSDIRILSFAPGTTRAHDQIEAFIPHLLAALREHHDNRPIPPSLVTRLTVFTRRMDLVRLSSAKLAAQLHALLMAAYILLGDPRNADRHRALYLRSLPAVTNPWTLILLRLIDSLVPVASGPLPESYDLRAIQLPSSPVSRFQRLIAAELTHYTSATTHAS